MYDESLRVPLLVRYPPLVPQAERHQRNGPKPRPGSQHPRYLRRETPPGIDGQSWKPLLAGNPRGWRASFLYFYNYEKEFPYTPNVRGIRTADWKYIYYPHGDGSPERYQAELYHLATDPLEMHNLINDPTAAGKLVELKKENARLMGLHKAVPDHMPLDGGIINVLPRF